MLVAELVGEPGVVVAKEELKAPATYLPFFWIVSLGQVAALIAAMWMPFVAVIAGLFFLTSHILFFDWRVSPLTWMGPKRKTANLIAKKGNGQRLFILMAHLDSAPASYAYRADQVKKFKASVYIGTGVVAFGVLVPLFDILGLVAPIWLRIFIAAIILVLPIIGSIDFWRFGYTPGANDNLSGVAAATAAASQLWRRMPEDSEVRLVITTAEEAGMLGAQHYARIHKGELRARTTYIVNFDTVGNKKLKYIRRSGGFTPVDYRGPLQDAAVSLCQQGKEYDFISAGEHHVGDFDSVWFVRAGLPTLTIASYDDDGMMPHIHTPFDTSDRVDLDQVARSALFGEALVRILPVGNLKT